MACSGYPGNSGAGSYSWCRSTRLRLPVQSSVRTTEGIAVHLQKLDASHLLALADTSDT